MTSDRGAAGGLTALFVPLRSFLAIHGDWTALGVLIVVVTLVNITWILQDTRPQPEVDPSIYLSGTFELVNRLAEGTAGDLQQSLELVGPQGRPPLYQLLSLPSIWLLGRSEDAAAMINLAFGVVLLLCTFGVAKLASSSRAGLLAAFLVAAYPPVAQLTRIYRPHSVLPACVALSMWLLLLLLKRRSVKVAWLFGASLAFGVLMHINFVYGMAAPTVLGLTYSIFFQTEPRRPSSLRMVPSWLLSKLANRYVVLGLLPAAVLAAGVAAAWFLPRIQMIIELERAVRMEFDWMTRGFDHLPRSFWWYARTAPGALSNVLSVLLVVGMVVCVLRRQLEILVLVTALVFAYIAFALRPGDVGWLHASAVLPVASAVTAVGLVELRYLRLGQRTRVSQILSNVLIWTGVAVAAFNFAFVTWDLGSWSRSIARALGSPSGTTTCIFRMHVAYCPEPARAENWHIDAFLATVLGDPACQEQECNLAVVPNHEYFNPAIFESALVRAFASSRDGLRLKDPGVWPAQVSDGEWLTSDYLAYISGIRHRGRGKAVRSEATLFLESPPPAFAASHSEVASLSLPYGWTASLVKRTENLTVEREIELYEEAAQVVPADVSLLRRLGHLALRIGDWSRAEEAFQDALARQPGLGWAHRSLGWLYQQQGLDEAAVEQYQKAIESEPFEPQAYRQLSDLNVSRGKLQQAVAVYELAVENNPGFVWPLLELGKVYVWSDEVPNARATFQRALALDPWNQEVLAQAISAHWSLASGLAVADARGGDTTLTWGPDGSWSKPYPDDKAIMAGPSVLSVGGEVQPDQIHLHPYGPTQATELGLDIKDSHYVELQVGSGLADDVGGLSNGVGFRVQVAREGLESATVLLDAEVKDSVWTWKTMPMLAFYGQDLVLSFQVDALGDDSYDWLQAAVRFVPAAEEWNLAEELAGVKVSAGEAPLTWVDATGWTDQDGQVLVAPSKSPVQGESLNDQILFHPAGSEESTTVRIAVAGNPFSGLVTDFALADGAAGQSDGVEYDILIKDDADESGVSLLDATVNHNAWETAVIDLSAYLGKDVTLELVSSSSGDDDYDWLQITFKLLALPLEEQERGG